MRIKDLKATLPFLLKHNICLFIWGNQGVGKTQTIKQYCKENNLQLVTLNTATQEVGDLVGLLVKDDATQTVKHARPTWFPTEGTGIIFLDELNRAPQEVIQALFPFVIEGKLHTHQLPPGWRVVAAGNYQSDKFTVTDTSDAAWMSRFCHIDFTPTPEEWADYAEGLGGAVIAAYIREYPDMLEIKHKDSSFDGTLVSPDRRAWTEGVLKLEADSAFPDNLRYEVYSGLIGSVASTGFLSWKEKQEKNITLTEILEDFSKVQTRLHTHSTGTEKRFDLYSRPLEDLINKIENKAAFLKTDNYLVNLKEYLLAIPKEVAMKTFVRLGTLGKFHGKDELLNDKEYVKRFI